MTEGDVVVYSLRHHDWLVGVGKWPSKFVPREARKGKVVLVDGRTVVVAWADGIRRHFAENLQVVP